MILLGMILQEKAIKIRERYSNFRENKDASISEIHDFVKKIPHLTKEFKYLQRHINIAGFLKSFTDSREFREMWQGIDSKVSSSSLFIHSDGHL